jgi:hypothetical protein
MPAGPPICALRASARRTSGSGSSGWPTPTSVERSRDEETLAKCAEFRKRNAGQNTVPLYLGETAQLAGWPTPRAGNNAGHGNIDRTNDPGNVRLEDTAQLAGWGTPTSQDGEHAGVSPAEAARDPNNLRTQVHMAGWATPASRDYRTPNHSTYAERGGGTKGEQLQNQAAHALHGASLSGSTALTESAGLLNPYFSSWLMGIPRVWLEHAPSPLPRVSRATSANSGQSATRSTRSSRRSS